MLDTLFIEDFMDSMEEYFLFYNHNWQLNSVALTKDQNLYLWYGIKKKYFIGKNKCIIKKNRVLASFQTRPTLCSYKKAWANNSNIAGNFLFKFEKKFIRKFLRSLLFMDIFTPSCWHKKPQELWKVNETFK